MSTTAKERSLFGLSGSRVVLTLHCPATIRRLLHPAQMRIGSPGQRIEEFRRVRLSTISLFRNLPPQAWARSGVASDNPFTVRALAFIVAGHLTHHVALLRERYL